MRGIPASTILFGSLTISLLVGLSFTIWLWRQHTGATPPEPAVHGTSVALGLPVQEPADRALFSARSALLWNTASDSIEFEQNGFERRPIASITKLMTAMVALDHGINWDKTTDIQLNEYVIGGRLLMHPGETATLRDLFHASLLGSANNATLAYVRELGLDNDAFVQAMNRKAVEIGLEQTQFADVTGLDEENISTAYEVAKMAAYAFEHYPAIREATSRPDYTFMFGGSGREHTIRNTNKVIVDNRQSFMGSKTGYLYEAGYCIVVQGSESHRDRIGVILGSPSEAEHFQDIEQLIQLPIT